MNASQTLPIQQISDIESRPLTPQMRDAVSELLSRYQFYFEVHATLGSAEASLLKTLRANPEIRGLKQDLTNIVRELVNDLWGKYGGEPDAMKKSFTFRMFNQEGGGSIGQVTSPEELARVAVVEFAADESLHATVNNNYVSDAMDSRLDMTRERFVLLADPSVAADSNDRETAFDDPKQLQALRQLVHAVNEAIAAAMTNMEGQTALIGLANTMSAIRGQMPGTLGKIDRYATKLAEREKSPEKTISGAMHIADRKQSNVIRQDMLGIEKRLAGVVAQLKTATDPKLVASLQSVVKSLNQLKNSRVQDAAIKGPLRNIITQRVTPLTMQTKAVLGMRASTAPTAASAGMAVSKLSTGARVLSLDAMREAKAGLSISTPLQSAQPRSVSALPVTAATAVNEPVAARASASATATIAASLVAAALVVEPAAAKISMAAPTTNAPIAAPYVAPVIQPTASQPELRIVGNNPIAPPVNEAPKGNPQIAPTVVSVAPQVAEALPPNPSQIGGGGEAPHTQPVNLPVQAELKQPEAVVQPVLPPIDRILPDVGDGPTVTPDVTSVPTQLLDIKDKGGVAIQETRQEEKAEPKTQEQDKAPIVVEVEPVPPPKEEPMPPPTFKEAASECTDCDGTKGCCRPMVFDVSDDEVKAFHEARAARKASPAPI